MGQGMECGKTGLYLGDEGSKPVCLEGVEKKMGWLEARRLEGTLGVSI